MVASLLKLAGWHQQRTFGSVSLTPRLWATVLVVISAMPSLSFAQDIAGGEPPDTAGNRPQEGYDASGISLGTIRAYPSLGLTSTYDSNVFARDTAVESDISATLVPSMRLEWERPGSQVSVSGDVRVRRYTNLKRQDDEQYRLESLASTEVARGTQLSVGTGWSRSTASRGTFENGLQIGGPLSMERLSGQMLARHRFNRLNISARFSAEQFSYGDVLLDDGTSIDQSFRDGRRFGGVLGAGYEVGPRLSIVGQGTVNRYDYENALTGLSRDATGYVVTGGMRYEVTRLLIAELGAGFRKHDFDDPTLNDISGLAPSAQLRWYPTPLLSLRFDLSHSTSTSAFDSVAAVAITSGRFSADHELRRNLILSLGADLSHEDYGRDNGASNLTSISGQAAWRPNRALRLTGRVSYDRRFSSSVSLVPEFDALRATLTAAIVR